jgi:hypothetical protein
MKIFFEPEIFLRASEACPCLRMRSSIWSHFSALETETLHRKVLCLTLVSCLVKSGLTIGVLEALFGHITGGIVVNVDRRLQLLELISSGERCPPK